MPERFQRRRTGGFRLPGGAKCVDRSTPWGNPFSHHAFAVAWPLTPEVRADAVDRYRAWLGGEGRTNEYICAAASYDRRWVLAHVGELRGLDLACYCPLPAEGEPDICHAVVLIELANGGPGD